MTFGSVCSGIEAASVAWHPLGWKTAFVSEIDAFPSALLKHHYPEVRNYGDFTAITADAGPIDVLVGGTPCQSFSVAGLRGGLDDDRGNLALEFCRLADRLRPRWIVWENVPGVLSSNGGRDFGSILGAMGELGYGTAYRVLDAQHFGVPQRRRRVFVVGYSGDWRRAAAVLFERHSLSGYPPPSRKTREDVAPTISARTKGGGGLGTDFDCDGGLVVPILEAGARTGKSTDDIRANQRHELTVNDTAGALKSGGGKPGQGYPAALQGSAVRRLTPLECERLQGFPDSYTAIPYRGKPAADGPRYKALGNSMAVPVMRWIGQRIQMVDAL